MSDYAFVADRAKKVFASVARLEQVLEENPNDRATELNLMAMRKLAAQARDELELLAKYNRIEICQYRLIPVFDVGYNVGSVGKVLTEYQNLFSQIFDALRNGAKNNVGVGRESAEQSSLEFGYTYSGSLGFTLLSKSKRDFFEGTLDQTIATLFDIINLRDETSVRRVARHLGKAVVKRAHDWSRVNVDGGFSVDVRWKLSDGRILGEVVDRSRMIEMISSISATSDKRTRTIDVIGFLLAVSLPKRTFQITVPEGEVFIGQFGDNILLPELTVGMLYRAKIEVSEITFYSTETDRVSYRLLSIEGPIERNAQKRPIVE
jgi:hypothetical protein